MKPETLKARVGQELIEYIQTNGQFPNVFECKVVWHNNFREAEIAKIRIIDSTYYEVYNRGCDDEYLFYSRGYEEFKDLLANITTDRLEVLQDPATCYDCINEDELSDSGEDFTIIDVVDMYNEIEDVASQKQRELLELANESISMLDEDGYIQFEKSIALDKETYPEYDWIDGIQLVDDSIVVWLSTEKSEDIFSSDIELFDEYTIDEMKSALQHTIKNLLKKS
jgi:hypothetical protein